MPLKLIAFDSDDLAVISAHLQHADLAAAHMAWLPREKRFAFVCTRQDRVDDTAVHACGVHFDRVIRVERLKMPEDTAARLKLIGITFAASTAPAGQIGLIFENGAALRLTVECVEAAMRDLEDEQDNG